MALSAARNTPQMGLGIPQLMSYPVLTGVTIYEGSIVVITAAGYAKPGVAETGDVAVGVATETITNAGGSGSVSVNVAQGVFAFDVNGSAVTIANLGDLCYVYDDATITLSSSGATIAGTIYGLQGTQAYVYFGLAPAIDGTSLSALNASVSEFKSNLVVPVTIPCVLSTAASAAIVGRILPRMSGTILALDAQVIAPVTTTAKLATISPLISGVAVTGGLLALTSTNCATLGARVTGSAITGTNTFTAAQEITLAASTVTAFTEGQVLLEMFLQSA